jgi:tetratricopeptide (TPR) repeat protein
MFLMNKTKLYPKMKPNHTTHRDVTASQSHTTTIIHRRPNRLVTSTTLVFLLAGKVIAGPEPFYEGLGSHQLKVTTKSPKAQRYFNQGLAFLHGFNHSAAIRSFRAAIENDPECAMAHWGISFASGPHINFPLVPPAAAETAWKELQLAQEHAPATTMLEQQLIAALAKRYANPQPEDRSPLDRAYADAMREVWRDHRDDDDVGAFFAEAMMNLRPWDQWTPEGQEQPGTAEIVGTLDAVLKMNANHPLANHLYIHAVEASPNPGRADAAAERLRGLQPGMAHNAHMPTHIDVRRGRWHDAVASNLKAVNADRAYRQKAGPPKGFLNLYTAHNRHMLAYAAMMTGQSKLAMEHIRAMVREAPADFIKEYVGMEGFAAMPMEVMVRFGRWDEILAEPDDYADHMPLSRAIHSAARAIAFAARNDTIAARKEQAILLKRAALVPKDEYFGNNLAASILAVATPMVEGEILVREAKLEEGLAALRTAVKAEDMLKYDEPPGWLIPVRHALGATLMRAGRYAEAEQVYRDDLARLPENGWSLRGLAQSLRSQSKNEAESVEARFQKVWAKADLEIPSSCLCQVLNDGG